MSFKILLFCILFVQTSASFFDEFRGAMSSVENSFGKLLSDVVTDVRDTIGCTILAVKQVLALGGIFHESSEYDARCRGISAAPTYVQETTNYAPTPPILYTTPPVYLNPTTVSDVTEKSLTEKVSDEIEASIKNVNNTMFELITKSDTHNKMENVTSSLLNESDRLAKLSTLLRHELSNISEDVKMDMSKIEYDISNPTIRDIWNNIKALHDIELNHRNSPEATEVHRILNEVLSVLRGYNYQSGISIVLPDERDTNNTFTQIEDQFLKIEQEESKELEEVEDIVETDLNIQSDGNKLNTNNIPVTFKDVAKKIMDETTSTLRLAEDFNGIEKPMTTSVERAVIKDVETIMDETSRILRLENLQEYKESVTTSTQKTFVQDARTIIGETTKTVQREDLEKYEEPIVPRTKEALFNEANSIIDETNKILQLGEPDEYKETVITSTEEPLVNDAETIMDETSRIFEFGDTERYETPVETRTEGVLVNDAKLIMDETNRILQFDDMEEDKKPIVSTTQETLVPKDAGAVQEDDPMESPEFTDLFQLPAKDPNSRKEAAIEAQKLIEKSKETEAFMNSYFEKSSDVGFSVFDDPDLFNFGKK